MPQIWGRTGIVYRKVGHYRQLGRRTFRRWLRRFLSNLFSLLDFIEKPVVRHPGLPEDLRGLSGNRFWALRRPLLRSSMRCAGTTPLMIEPYLAFVDRARSMDNDEFESSLHDLFLDFEERSNLQLKLDPNSALSDYRFFSARGLSYPCRGLREHGLARLNDEIKRRDDSVGPVLLSIGMGDFSGAHALYENIAQNEDCSSFEHLAISYLFEEPVTPSTKGKFLDQRLLSLVEGKRICILGPGPGSESAYQDGLGDSLILRFEEARRPPHLQRKVEIGWEDTNPSRIEPKYVGNQKILMLNYPEFTGRFSGNLPHVVRQEMFEGLGGYGLPLGATRAALNLLPYGPSGIYMSGIDFFLSDSQYEQGYGGLHQEDRLFHHWTLMHGHDLIANLHLGKALWLTGKVSGDEGFLRAIDTAPAVAAQTYDHTYWHRLRKYISPVHHPVQPNSVPGAPQ